MKYHKQQDNEWIEPQDNYRMGCCDCGLVHDMTFRVEDGRVQFMAVRNTRATAQMRRARDPKPTED